VCIAKEISTLEYAKAWLKVEETGQLLPQVFGEERPQVGDRVQVVLALESCCQWFKMISSPSALHDFLKMASVFILV
jgi:hypothetical protein